MTRTSFHWLLEQLVRHETRPYASRLARSIQERAESFWVLPRATRLPFPGTPLELDCPVATAASLPTRGKKRSKAETAVRIHRKESPRSQSLLKKMMLSQPALPDDRSGDGGHNHVIGQQAIFGLNGRRPDAALTSLYTMDPCSHRPRGRNLYVKLLCPYPPLSAADSTTKLEAVANEVDPWQENRTALQRRRKIINGTLAMAALIQLAANVVSMESTNACKGAMDENGTKCIATRSPLVGVVIVRGPRSLPVGAVSTRRRLACDTSRCAKLCTAQKVPCKQPSRSLCAKTCSIRPPWDPSGRQPMLVQPRRG